MAKKVLIVIDNSKRELFGSMLLAEYLASLGFKPVLCSIVLYQYYYLRYRPEAVVWPNIFFVNPAITKNSFNFVLPSESGNGQPEQIRATHGGKTNRKIYFEHIDKFFCWGEAMKEVLLDTGKWGKEQLATTGSPSCDHWLMPNSLTAKRGQRIGVTTTFRALSNNTPLSKSNYFQWLDSSELYGSDGTYYLPPEHAESWLFFEASLARVIAGVVRELSANTAQGIEIRPHPMESEARYEYFKKISAGKVSINKRGAISEWLRDKSVLFTFISASAIDAFVRGIPVASLKNLLDKDALRKIPSFYVYDYDDFFWQVDSFSDISKFALLASKGELALCRDQKGLSDFVLRNFYYPRNNLSAELIALEIKNTLEKTSPCRKGIGSLNVETEQLSGIKGHIHKALRRSYARGLFSLTLAPLLSLIALAKYLHGLLPGSEDLSSFFQPWRFRDMARIRRMVKKLTALNKEC